MAATVSAWAKPGAWALEAEEHDASLHMDNNKNELLETPDSTMASDFPSLSVAVAVAAGKGSKKKGRKISLAEFSTGHPVSHGTAKFRPSAASFNENIDLVLPTGPRERTAEELEWSSSSRGDRSRWGSSRDDHPRRGGGEGGFGGERERDGGPSRADEVDDWGAGKKFANVAPSRERFSGGGGGGFFDSQSRADESGSWVSNKRSTPVTMPSSNGRRSSDGYRDAENWGRREKDSEVTTGGGRPRLLLQPRSLPLQPANASSGDGDALKTTKTSTNPFGGARPREEVLQTKPPPAVEEVQNTVPVKIKSSTNPFGAARPREEVLAEKGHDWKKIDEKLESAKVRETPGFGNRASGLANGSRTDDKTVSSWRKANAAAAVPTSPPSMHRFFKPIGQTSRPPTTNPPPTNPTPSTDEVIVEHEDNDHPSDPGLRKSIWRYSQSVRDEVRRYYWSKGPCQPNNITFPQTMVGDRNRRFNPQWFDTYTRWLEYSEDKDAVFCLCCYLFKSDSGVRSGRDAFVSKGFRDWKHYKKAFGEHVGNVDSTHNYCLQQCDMLFQERRHIDTALINRSREDRKRYQIRLHSSTRCVKFLLLNGLPFRGHMETDDSDNPGNFLELLKFLGDSDPIVKSNTFENAPGNLKCTSPYTQGQIINACAIETTNIIIQEVLQSRFFSILVDEARDVSVKEQMGIVLRYVNVKGIITERFVEVIHVADTSSHCLMNAVSSFLDRHHLSISNLRGQGYDGASNMRGEFNDLKSHILKLNPHAHYIHCFAHKLQLALVSCARNERKLDMFFQKVTRIVNICGASCKRQDKLRQIQLERLKVKLEDREINTGRGLNQETVLQRPGDTRWGSHFKTLLSMKALYSSVIDVLRIVAVDASDIPQRNEAENMEDEMVSFEFIFFLHLMIKILGYTNALSQALQKRDQDIANAMRLVEMSKKMLQDLRDNGWDPLLAEVNSFCEQENIMIVDMEEDKLSQGRPRRNEETHSNDYYYRVEIYYSVIDMQLQDLNTRFSDANTELLTCVAALHPSDNFSSFNKTLLVRMANLYPQDFSEVEVLELGVQLDMYIFDVSTDENFLGLTGMAELGPKMVMSKKADSYPLVYRLLKLAMILPVATATVERVFSAMKLLKTVLRNRMSDQLMNDCMVTYIERGIFRTITEETIMERFQNMRKRRMELPRIGDLGV